MNKISYIILFFCLLIGTAISSSVTITDNYIGGSPNYSYYDGMDVIGHPVSFDISSMSVDLDRQARKLSVSISSGYMDNIGMYSTQLGDLFLSSDGWKVNGNESNGYKTDQYKSGEWNYAVVLDNHLGTSGVAKLYAITDDNVKMSWAPNNYVYREHQAVQVKNIENSIVLGTGTWNVNTASNILSLSIGFGNVFDNNTEFAFHWGMTCANDVIEGAATFAAVPEPSIIVLIIFGIGILVLHGRTHFNKI